MKTKFPECKDCRVLNLEGYTPLIRKTLCSNCNNKSNYDKSTKTERDLIREYELINKQSGIDPCLIVRRQ